VMTIMILTRIHRSLWRRCGRCRTSYNPQYQHQHSLNCSLKILISRKLHPTPSSLIPYSPNPPFFKSQNLKRNPTHRIIILTVCPSKGLQSPFTNASLNSPSLNCPLRSRSTAPNNLQSASLSFPSLGGAGAGVGGGLFCNGGLP